jgi:hypothetical protein
MAIIVNLTQSRICCCAWAFPVSVQHFFKAIFHIVYEASFVGFWWGEGNCFYGKSKGC